MKMEKKTVVIVAVGMCLVLLVVGFIYLLPLLGEVFSSKTTLGCIGSGCHSFSASSTSGMGGVDCWGYKLFLFCFSTPEKYCRYAQPLDSMEKCVCEAPSPHFRGSGYRKFCEKDKKCYTNSFEYEFGCAEDIEKTCRETEKVFTEPNACGSLALHYLSYGLVRNELECLKSWLDIYIYADDDQKHNIFNKYQNICTLICQNCNSTLCDKGNICEYVKFPINATKND